jgi:hypothetical protein
MTHEWRYQVREVSPPEEVEGALSDSGLKGWELVTVLPTPTGWTLFFKQPADQAFRGSSS